MFEIKDNGCVWRQISGIRHEEVTIKFDRSEYMMTYSMNYGGMYNTIDKSWPITKNSTAAELKNRFVRLAGYTPSDEEWAEVSQIFTTYYATFFEMNSFNISCNLF